MNPKETAEKIIKNNFYDFQKFIENCNDPNFKLWENNSEKVKMAYYRYFYESFELYFSEQKSIASLLEDIKVFKSIKNNLFVILFKTKGITKVIFEDYFISVINNNYPNNQWEIIKNNN